MEQMDSQAPLESIAPVDDAPVQDTAPAPERRFVDPDAPKAEAIEVSTDPDDDLVAIVNEESDGQPDTDESEPELMDVEYEGKTYKLTAEIKDALMRQGDYTKKTMEVADQRKAVEAQQTEFQANVKVQEQFFEEASTVRQIDAQLAQYEQVDWNQLSYDDPVEFQRLDFQRRQLVENRTNTVQRMIHAQQEVAQKQHQEGARLKEEGLKELAKVIPNWNEDTAKTIFKSGIDTYGFSKDEMSSVLDPRMVRVLDDARRYRNIVAKSKSNKAPKPAEAQPVASIKGKNAKASVNPDNLSVKAWQAWREKDLKAKGRR